MIRILWSLILLIIIFIAGCKRYDTSGIKDNGEWVSIYEAPVTSEYILHNDKVYGLGLVNKDSIPWDEVWASYPIPIDYVDIKTLYINIINDTWFNYAKDDKYVYCPAIGYVFCDGDSDLIIYSEFYGDIRVPGADPKTFKYLGDGYAVDKNGMYSKGHQIEWNDSIIAQYNN